LADTNKRVQRPDETLHQQGYSLYVGPNPVSKRHHCNLYGQFATILKFIVANAQSTLHAINIEE
jgi:hypothetical protein